jgi:hypothetical protein
MDLVCDPFNGTATTGKSALLFNRSYRGYDINPEFIMQSEIRLDMPTEEDLEFVELPRKRVGRNPMSKKVAIAIESRKKEYEEALMNQIKSGIENGFTVISAFSI